jgi:tetratricopeptide (TPR) repeat protein
VHDKPDYAEAYYTMGSVYKQMNKLPEAAEALRTALKLQPDFAGAHTTLAGVLRQLGDATGAAEESRAGAEWSRKKTNQQAALFATNSGRRLLDAGDIEGAISQLRRAVNAAPDYAPGHFYLGTALSRKGLVSEANAEFAKATELDPRLKAPTR